MKYMVDPFIKLNSLKSKLNALEKQIRGDNAKDLDAMAIKRIKDEHRKLVLEIFREERRLEEKGHEWREE